MRPHTCTFLIASLASSICVTGAAQQPPLTMGSWEDPVTKWALHLRMNGGKVDGMVSHCATVLSRPVDITAASLSGNEARFECTSPDRARSIAFSAQLVGTTLDLKWTRQLGAGASGGNSLDKIFGTRTSGQMSLTRVADGELAELSRQTRGFEYAAAVNLPEKNTKVEGVIFLPRATQRVRAALIIFRYGLGGNLHASKEWRELSERIGGAVVGVRYSTIGPNQTTLAGVNPADGGADALIELMARLSSETRLPDVRTAPWVLWGHSAGGALASFLAALHPQRTLAFVRHNSGPASADVKALAGIPSLLVAGTKDTAPAAETLWKSGRASGAPWTFGLIPNGTHEDLSEAEQLTMRWIESVVSMRLPSSGLTLRAVADRDAWLGDRQTRDVFPSAAFRGELRDANWLPDEGTARAWAAMERLVK